MHGDTGEGNVKKRAGLAGPAIAIPLCAAWVLGLLASHALTQLPVDASWFTARAAWAAAIASALAAAWRRTAPGDRAARRWIFAAVFLAAMGWWMIRVARVPADDIGHWAGATPQITRVIGTLEGPTHLTTNDRGAMGAFGFTPPATLAVIKVERAMVNNQMRPASGRLLFRVGEADPRLRAGLRIEAEGWLATIDGPMNPGEFDYRAAMRERGIHGRLTAPVRANWKPRPAESDPDPPNRLTRLDNWRMGFSQSSSDAASVWLRAGMPKSGEELAFLDAVLLGRWDRQIGDLSDAFRRAGLTHLLAISGANLTILLGIVWLFFRSALGGFNRPLIAVMLVLAGYLLMLPAQVPILRAGLMAAVFCVAMLSGRAVRAVDSLAVAAILLLIWRPADLFDPGLQLSFGGVAALLALTGPVADAISPRPINRDPETATTFDHVWRFAWEYLAASLAVWAVTLPLLAFHFGAVTPASGLWTMLLTPFFSLLMGLGYFKMMIGFIFPSLSILAAAPLHLLTDAITRSVEAAAAWKWTLLSLPAPPSWAWALAAIATLWSLFSGRFSGMHKTRAPALLHAAAALTLCTLWLLVPQLNPPIKNWARDGAGGVAAPALNPGPAPADAPALRLYALAVGDGSCFLMRFPPTAPGTRETVLLFDCGSQQYLSLGVRTVAPALKELGITRIDAAIVSHADLDHYGGLLDVLDAVPVGRVFVTPQMHALARSTPASAVHALVAGVEKRGVPIELLSGGWKTDIGEARVVSLWPPANWTSPRTNDSSIVLRISVAGRRALLCGDVQNAALGAMLDAGIDLRADIVELAHHGSYVDLSPRWIRAINPSLVLQSCGAGRARTDPWEGWFNDNAFVKPVPGAAPPRLPAARRLMTARLGMIESSIARDGSIAWRSFRVSDAVGQEP